MKSPGVPAAAQSCAEPNELFVGATAAVKFWYITIPTAMVLAAMLAFAG
jgi:hypothetical protein